MTLWCSRRYARYATWKRESAGAAKKKWAVHTSVNHIFSNHLIPGFLCLYFIYPCRLVPMIAGDDAKLDFGVGYGGYTSVII